MTAALKVWPPTDAQRPDSESTPLLWWQPDRLVAPDAWRFIVHQPEQPAWIIRRGDEWALGLDGRIAVPPTSDAMPAHGFLPAVPPTQLGDAGFRADHRLQYAYVTGAMANGIASEELVEAVSRAGMLGFFGAAGLSPNRVEQAIHRLQTNLGEQPFGFNLIHSPHEPLLEAAVVDLYIRHGIRLVEASAYLDLTLPLVRYRVHGIHRNAQGDIVTPHRVVGKVSRIEVASKFFAPPPDKFLRELVQRGELTEAQAQLARQVPMAQDLTAEADSGGHTDNRPLIALLPTLMALRDRMQPQFPMPLRVGAAGGIATPAGAAAAFALGAAYIVTGSINQACIESGSSDRVRQMLAEAGQADVMMAPAADMFEMGVKVQVLKRGTMFPMRAAKLFELYRDHDRWDAIPPTERAKVERDIFRKSFAEVWQETRAFWQSRDARNVDRAEAEPKHKMALVFRWYLGLSSRWANEGEPSRQADYQVWCGPAMGAFNEWTKGTPMQNAANRRVADVGRSLMHGAAVQTRINMLRCQGVPVPAAVAAVPPGGDLA
jgi:PfaD family protein